MKSFLLGCMTIALLGTAACSGGSKKPDRKKLPALNNLGVSEQFNINTDAGIPFATGEMEVQTGSTQSIFHSISLPDDSYDSVALQLVASHESSALALLSAWSSRPDKGIVIDLRLPNGGSGHRVDYTLERTGSFSIPVVFLYDHSSEARAASLAELLHSIPSIQCSRNGSYSSNGRQDCFSSAGSSF
jgi:hypothetical protein